MIAQRERLAREWSSWLADVPAQNGELLRAKLEETFDEETRD